MEKKKQKKMKFTWIDALIIIVVIVALVVGVKILSRSEPILPVEKKLVSAVIEVKEIDQGFVDSMKVGDTIFLTVDNVDPATITDIKVEPNKIQGLDEVGEVYKYTSTENSKYVAYVTVEAEATETEANISVGNTPLKVGKSAFVKGKGYSAKGYVVQVDMKVKGE